MLSVAEMLDRLSQLYNERDGLQAEKEKVIAKALPPEVKARLDDIEAEFAGKEEAAEANIEELEDSIKTATLAHGESVRGSGFQAVWNKGRLTWDSKGLTAYADDHPEVLQFRKEGEPSVTVRKVTAKAGD